MAYGRRCEEWDQTSLLVALIHNTASANDKVDHYHYHPLRNAPAAAGPERIKISIEDFARVTGGTLEVIR